MIPLASLRAGLSPIGRHVPCFFVRHFGIALEPIAGGTNHCSTPLCARKKKLDAIGDPRIKYAWTPGDRKQAAQFDFRRSVAFFLFWVKRRVWAKELQKLGHLSSGMKGAGSQFIIRA